MVYFTLPSFYYNYKINNFFITFTRNHENFLKYPVAFVATSGNFPYNYWNGGFNAAIGDGCVYDQINECNKNNICPLRLNCTNIRLGKEDFEDAVANTILDICHDSSNYIELVNFDLYKFLSERYKKYKFIFSHQADLIYPFTPEIINQLIDKNCFELITLPSYWSKNVYKIKEIKDCSNIELVVNKNCAENCSMYKNCLLNNHDAQYNYSIENTFLACGKRPPYEDVVPLVSLDNIYNIFYPLGIKHYKLEEMCSNDKDHLLWFYIDYFIKDEYKSEVLRIAMKEGLILV